MMLKCTLFLLLVLKEAYALTPRLIASSPSPPSVFNETFTLSCTVEGNPLPRVTWIMNNERQGQQSITNLAGSPFFIKNIPGVNAVESRLTMKAGGFCLDRSFISCLDSSDLSRTPIRLRTFTINNDTFEKFESSYFVFSNSHTRLYANRATAACIEKGGQLTSVRNTETFTFLQTKAKALYRDRRWSQYALIGLKEENGEYFWLNQVPYSSSSEHWDDGEPNPTSWGCVYMNQRSDWKWHSTDDCDYPYAYVCEIQSNEDEAMIENVIAPKCNNETVTSLSIKWRPFANAQEISHDIRARIPNTGTFHNQTVIPEQTLDSDGVSEIIFRNLMPRVSYEVTIYFLTSFCSTRRYVRTTTTTGYGIPQAVKNPSLRLSSDKRCIVEWEWPEEEIISVKNFVIRISSYSRSPANGIEVPDKIVEMRRAANKRMLSFTTLLPNRRHDVEVAGETCGGKGPAVASIGTCLTPPKAPIVSPPTINTVGNKILLSLTDIDQRNGTISCFFVIGVFHDEEVQINTTEASEEFLDSLARTNATDVKAGQPYLAIAISSSLDKDITFAMGDGSNSSCDVTRIPSSRQIREALNDTFYHGNNVPLQVDKFYSFYVIYTTPLGDEKIEYTASEAKSHRTAAEPLTEDATGMLWIIIGVVAAVLVIVIFVAIICITRKRKSSQDIQRKPDGVELHEPSSFGENAPAVIKPVYSNLPGQNIANEYENTAHIDYANVHPTAPNNQLDPDYETMCPIPETIRTHSRGCNMDLK